MSGQCTFAAGMKEASKVECTVSQGGKDAIVPGPKTETFVYKRYVTWPVVATAAAATTTTAPSTTATTTATTSTTKKVDETSVAAITTVAPSITPQSSSAVAATLSDKVNTNTAKPSSTTTATSGADKNTYSWISGVVGSLAAIMAII